MSVFLLIIGLVLLHKSQYKYVLLIAIVMATNLFDTIKGIEFPVRHEMGDLGLLLFILTWIKSLKDGYGVPETPIYRWLMIFGGFLTVSFTVDILSNPVSFSEVILTGRRFVLYIAAYILVILDEEELNFILRSVVIINMILLGAIGLQYMGVVNLFSYNFDHYVDKDFLGFYAPLSLMASAFILLSPLGKEFFPKYYKLFLIVCSIAILLTVIRSYIISYVVGIMIVLTLGKGINRKNVMAFVAMALVILISIQFIPQVGNRFSQVSESVETGSMAFRATIVDQAISQTELSLKNSIFGIGWKYLDFTNASSWTLSDWVLATPDTSWPPLFGRLGFVGTVLYLIPVIIMLYCSYRYRHNEYSPILAALLIHVVIISFAGSSLTQGKTFIIPYIIYFIIIKSEGLCLESR